MRRSLAALLILTAGCQIAAAQTTVPKGDAHPGGACPPGTMQNAPTAGRPSDKPIGDQLAESKGVICPPAGVDPEMRQPSPQGGAIQVIPPPGTPGGDQSVQPK